jgi:hypothetical protein
VVTKLDDEFLGHTTEEWQPMPINMGPPLPKFLGIYWPWYEEAIPGAADIRVKNLSISPASVNIGQTVTISVTATNYSSTAGSKKITCSVDGTTSEQTVTLEGWGSQVVSFQATPSEAKTYQVSVNGLTGSFTAVAEGVPPTVYTCSYCGATFATNEELQAHIASAHPEQPPVGEAKFEYASDIRETGLTTYKAQTYYNFEVDVKNSGTAKGTCHPIAYGDCAYGSLSADMGTKEIAPGETVTFSGSFMIYTDDPDYWYRLINIKSEAGTIAFAGGVIEISSVTIPSKITSKSEYQASASAHLQYGANRLYSVRVYLEGGGQFWVPISIYAPTGGTMYAGFQSDVISAQVGAVEVPIGFRSHLLSQSGLYTVDGVWLSTSGTSPMTKSPAKAILGGVFNIDDLKFLYGVDVYRTYDYNIPLPNGKYTVKGSIQEYTVYDLGGGRAEFFGGAVIWSGEFGEVQVTGGPVFNEVIPPKITISPASASPGQTVIVTVEVTNNSGMTANWQLNIGWDVPIKPGYIWYTSTGRLKGSLAQEQISLANGQKKTYTYSFTIPSEANIYSPVIPGTAYITVQILSIMTNTKEFSIV